jgi:hypothetical protein
VTKILQPSSAEASADEEEEAVEGKAEEVAEEVAKEYVLEVATARESIDRLAKRLADPQGSPDLPDALRGEPVALILTDHPWGMLPFEHDQGNAYDRLVRCVTYLARPVQLHSDICGGFRAAICDGAAQGGHRECYHRADLHVPNRLRGVGQVRPAVGVFGVRDDPLFRNSGVVGGQLFRNSVVSQRSASYSGIAPSAAHGVWLRPTTRC